MDSVDFSQRYADSEDDAYLEQAERITRSLEKSDGFKYSGQFADPEKRQEFVEQLAAELSGKKPMPKPAQPEEEEKWSSDKFWNDPEELQKAAKAVRPRKL